MSGNSSLAHASKQRMHLIQPMNEMKIINGSLKSKSENNPLRRRGGET